MKFLIVDDSSFFRGLLRNELINSEVFNTEKDPLEIIEADDKHSALEQVKNNNPELILLDIVMRDSEIEGIEILEDIYKNYPKTKVIVITSVGQSSVINRCKALGVRVYIGKPFDSSQLTTAIKNTLIDN